jgi:glycosyltransferase involved in cell wall biosynthesis
LSQPLITVLIDTYNYGRFIEVAIDSVLAQDFDLGAVEILVVDDGSSDDTRERVGQYGERVRYLWKENGGQASALNLGFAASRGEIVATLDADDYFLPGKLRRVVEEFGRRPGAGMVYHARLNLRGGTGEFDRPEFAEVSGFVARDATKLLKYDLHPTSCLAFRRHLVSRLLPIPESLPIQADGHLVLLMPLIAEVAAVAEALAVYRLHGGNLFFLDEQAAVGVEQRKKWIASFRAVVQEGELWAGRHQEELRGVPTRRYFSRWRLPLEEREFAFDTPGRLRYFWFLLRRNYTGAPIQSVRFTMFNYLGAVMAVVLGYGRASSLNQRMLAWFQALSKGGRAAG